jgi:hypothetical protein
MPVGDGRDAHDTHSDARSWEEWRHKEQHPGGSSEPHRGEPVQFPPLPPYDSPTAPDLERSAGHGAPEQVPEVQRNKTPAHPREREPGTKKHSPPAEVVSVPVPPAHPDPTPLAPVKQVPIHYPEPMQSAPVMITHLVEPGALPEEHQQQPEVEPPSEVKRTPVVEASPPSLTSTTGMRHKPVQKSTDPGEKDTDAGGKATGGGNMKKLEEEYDGEMGRKHTEEQIEEILDVYLQTGLLPTYVTQKMRWLYKHHRRLPQRRELLEQAGKQIVIPEVGGNVHNITPIQRAEVHHRTVSS